MKRLGLHSRRGWKRHVLQVAAIRNAGSQEEAIDAPAGTQLWWPPYTGEGGWGGSWPAARPAEQAALHGGVIGYAERKAHDLRRVPWTPWTLDVWLQRRRR
jgi:hypothetical protein